MIPDDMVGTAKTPVASHIFTTNQDCMKLMEKKAQVLHHLVMKLLYLCMRTRQDIQTVVAFLCMKVENPDMDDYKYLWATKDLMLMIEPGNHPNWWVDSSYPVHLDLDMCSHSGIYMTLGKVVTYSGSTKQSSTEVDLVAIDDVMGQILWTHHLLGAHGEYVPMTTLYQDIKSMILLTENGRNSSSN